MSDAEIEQSVQEELTWDARVRPTDVSVSVRDGIVALSGMVDSFAKRQIAERVALRVRGVKAVVNELEVQLPSAAERTDADLARAVLAALTWDADIPTRGVSIAISHGWVTLTGTVDTLFQRQQAERALHRLAGITGVTNELMVRSLGPTPADVKQRIERALLRNAETDAEHITVEVQGTKVILKGTVHSHAERLAAEGSALSAPGITEVENLLVVYSIV
jgi:osmotically-inducible protein OsmY